jgi:hypothetical protein
MAFMRRRRKQRQQAEQLNKSAEQYAPSYKGFFGNSQNNGNLKYPHKQKQLSSNDYNKQANNQHHFYQQLQQQNNSHISMTDFIDLAEAIDTNNDSEIKAILDNHKQFEITKIAELILGCPNVDELKLRYDENGNCIDATGPFNQETFAKRTALINKIITEIKANNSAKPIESTVSV